MRPYDCQVAIINIFIIDNKLSMLWNKKPKEESELNLSIKKIVFAFIILGLSACTHAPQNNEVCLPRVVAKIGDTAIRRDQVLQEAAPRLQKLRREQYDILKEALNRLIEQKLIDAAAAKEGKTGEEWIKEQVDLKIIAPTYAEIENVYQRQKARLNGQTLEEAKPKLANMLMNQQRQDLYVKLINALKARTQVTVLLEPLRVPVADNGRPRLGPLKAPVTIIEFSDYECSFCARAEETMRQIRKVYGDLVQIVFRNYPLSFHPNAQKAAEAAGCAEEQGKFWELHDKLFDNPTKLAVENITAYARELGLDMAAFEQCLNSGKRAVEVAKDFEDGNRAGVSGTPAFFINGRFLSGARPFKAFAEIIDEELTRAGIKIPPKPIETAAQL